MPSPLCFRSAYSSGGAFATPQYEERKCGKERLRLLKAPSMEASAMWKAQAFDRARARLRGKLNDTITADEAIAFLGEYFPLSALTAEEEARRVASDLKTDFE